MSNNLFAKKGLWKLGLFNQQACRVTYFVIFIQVNDRYCKRHISVTWKENINYRVWRRYWFQSKKHNIIYIAQDFFFFSATSAKAPKGLAMTFSENFPVNSATLLLFKFTLHKQEKKEKKETPSKREASNIFSKKGCFFFFWLEQSQQWQADWNKMKPECIKKNTLKMFMYVWQFCEED